MSKKLKDKKTYEHKWECISPGMYDFLYECSKCGKKHIESIDNPESVCPKYGCVKHV